MPISFFGMQRLFREVAHNESSILERDRVQGITGKHIEGKVLTGATNRIDMFDFIAEHDEVVS